jgi:hypothetical protein
MNKLEISIHRPTKIEEDTDISVSFCFTAVVQIYLQIHAVKQNRAYWSKFGTLQTPLKILSSVLLHQTKATLSTK